MLLLTGKGDTSPTFRFPKLQIFVQMLCTVYIAQYGAVMLVELCSLCGRKIE